MLVLCVLFTGCGTSPRSSMNTELRSKPMSVTDTHQPELKDEVDIFLLLDSEEVDLARIDELVDSGMNLNTRHANGMTPLMYAAARARNPEVIRCLITAGANLEDLSLIHI